MSFQIPTAFVQQYHAEVKHLAQQNDSRMAGKCRQEPQHAKTQYFDQLGIRTARKLTVRHGPTIQDDTPHQRRACTFLDYVDTDFIDDEDKLRIMMEPENNYAMASAKALRRAKDDAFVAAALGNAFVGETGATTLAWPPTGDTSSYYPSGTNPYGPVAPYNQFAAGGGQVVSSSSIGMTLAKLISTLEKFNLNDIDTDEGKYLVVGPKQVSDMLKLTEVNSADYNNIKVLTQGKVVNYMGFEMIMSNRLSTTTTTAANDTRQCIAWVAPAILFTTAKDITLDVGPRRDLNGLTQVQTKASFGCTRMEEKGVVESDCLES